MNNSNTSTMNCMHISLTGCCFSNTMILTLCMRRAIHMMQLLYM